MQVGAGHVADFTVRWIAKDGHFVWTHHICRKVLRADGSVVVYGVARDATSVLKPELEFADSEKHFRLLALNTVGNDLGNLTWVSQSVYEWLGWSADELVGRPFPFLVHPDDAQRLREIREAISHAEPVVKDLRLLTKTGSYRWVSVFVRAEVNDVGVVTGRIAGWRDVEDVRDVRAALARAQAQYHLIADNAMDVVFQSDTQGVLAWISPSVTQVLGWQPGDIVGKMFASLVHPEDVAAAVNVKELAVSLDGKPVDAEVRIRQAQGGWRWVRLTGRAMRDSDGTLVGTLDTLHDIDLEMSARQRLDFHVTHDPLTGLGNRDLLMRRAGARDSESRACILICFGIDNLADVSEAYTHEAGESAVVAVAKALVEGLGPQTEFYRTGDNQITALLAADAEEGVVLDVVARAQAAAGGEVPIDGSGFEVSLSAGIAIGSTDHVAELLRDATSAMLRASELGGRHVEFADSVLAQEAGARITLRAGVAHALREGAMKAWYQPVVGLSDGQLQGYEALVRWELADGTVLLPATFLPIAESSGLIVALDDRVREQALESLRTLPEPMHIAVNVSAASLADSALVDRVQGQLHSREVDPRRLHLEVTETNLIDVTDQVHETMVELARLGIRWWVDDFGTGYSSVSHLRDLPVFGLKLDRSFTQGMMTDQRTRRRAGGLAGLARGMGLATIAEGIETGEEAQMLRGLGWEWGQGWFFGKPAPLPQPQE